MFLLYIIYYFCNLLFLILEVYNYFFWSLERFQPTLLIKFNFFNTIFYGRWIHHDFHRKQSYTLWYLQPQMCWDWCAKKIPFFSPINNMSVSFPFPHHTWYLFSSLILLLSIPCFILVRKTWLWVHALLVNVCSPYFFWMLTPFVVTRPYFFCHCLLSLFLLMAMLGHIIKLTVKSSQSLALATFLSLALSLLRAVIFLSLHSGYYIYIKGYIVLANRKSLCFFYESPLTFYSFFMSQTNIRYNLYLLKIYFMFKRNTRWIKS